MGYTIMCNLDNVPHKLKGRNHDRNVCSSHNTYYCGDHAFVMFPPNSHSPPAWCNWKYDYMIIAKAQLPNSCVPVQIGDFFLVNYRQQTCSNRSSASKAHRMQCTENDEFTDHWEDLWLRSTIIFCIVALLTSFTSLATFHSSRALTNHW